MQPTWQQIVKISFVDGTTIKIAKNFTEEPKIWELGEDLRHWFLNQLREEFELVTENGAYIILRKNIKQINCENFTFDYDINEDYEYDYV